MAKPRVPGRSLSYEERRAAGRERLSVWLKKESYDQLLEMAENDGLERTPFLEALIDGAYKRWKRRA